MNSKASFWSAIPFIRVIIPFTFGILGYDHFNYRVYIGLLFIALSLFTAYLLLAPRTRFRFPFLPGFGMLITAFLLGFFTTYCHDAKNAPTWLGHQNTIAVVGIPVSQPIQGTYYTSFILKVQGAETRLGPLSATGNILVKTKMPANRFHKGDTLLILKTPTPLANSTGRLTGYIRHLNRKNIWHQLVISEPEFIFLHRSNEKDLITTMRNEILARINRHVKGKNENALAKALLVGERAELDKELSSAYTNTGVIHIIAISGMHLALIYSILAMVLKPLDGFNQLKWLKIFLIIIALWTFSFICGASASVIRSAVMFSFLLAGQRLEKDNNPLNTLAASGFLMLAINPLLVYDIGFQLSYAAVGSLLLFNRPVSSLFVPENKLLALGWNTISTSISAQVLTTPLVMVHFHQFPLLFILSNLVAVPLSGIILVVLILVCILDPINNAATVFGTVATTLIRLMNERIISLGSVPFAKWENINISWYDVVNMYLLILLLSLWRRSKK